MSRNHKEGRNDGDRYYTKPVLVAAIIRWYQDDLPTTAPILDLGCGEGRFFQPLILHSNLTGVDTDPKALAIARKRVPHATFIEADALTWSPPERYRTIIGNPPFNIAAPLLLRALDWADTTIFLLPSSFLGSDGRYETFYSNAARRPAEVVHLSPRPSFDLAAPGSPMYDHIVAVWRRGHTSPTQLHWKQWRRTGKTAQKRLRRES